VAFSKGDGTFSVTNVPLPGPAAPSNPQVTDETLTTLKIAWEINSSRHSGFLVNYGKSIGQWRTVAVGFTGRHVLFDLDSDTRYCFNVQARNFFGGVSAKSPDACGRTQRPEPEPTSGTTTVWLNRDRDITQGPVPYVGSWGPLTGARPVRLWLPDRFGDEYIYFLRAGHSTTECFGSNHSNVTVTLKDGGTLGPTEIAQIQGATPPAGQKVYFVACQGTNPYQPTVPDSILFNLDWKK
jgi:hypothetical protein